MGSKAQPNFKVGNRVRYVSGNHGVSSNNPLWSKYKVEGTIDEPLHNKNWLGVKWDNGESNSYHPEDLELVSRKGKSKKEIPPKFLLKYDLDEDPIEEFATLPEVRKRIKTLVAEETSLKRDSIVVYEIKRKMSVRLDTSITIK